jgi:transketolase
MIKKAQQIRDELIRVAVANNKGHIAPSLSCVEILVALYYSIMKPEDRFILSKAHGCYSLYAILADKGKIPKDVWENFKLDGCATRNLEYGIEAGCGSLGHGLPMAAGMAWALKLQGLQGKVYCLVGDGEMQEGSNWEALQFAVNKNLDNLYVIIDGNKLEAMCAVKETGLRNDVLLGTLTSMGMCGVAVDGHDTQALVKYINGFDCLGHATNKPRLVYAQTIKGKGLSFMENIACWHYRTPTSLDFEGGET